MNGLNINGLLSGCAHKNRYGTETLARLNGREFAAVRGIDLYVYQCAYCAGWHLTKKERVEYWHVNKEIADSDTFEDITGDPLFWHRLFEMPHQEAEQILRKTRHDVAMRMQGANGADNARLNFFLSRLKDEIHLLSRVTNNARWTDSIRKVLGQDALDQVLIDMRLAIDEGAAA